MWITQTYLGTVEPNANLFVYYMFENYDDAQTEFSHQVQKQLEGVADTFRDKVSLLIPNNKYANRIEAELRNNKELWDSLEGQLPGLFLSRKPLNEYNGTDEGNLYLAFNSKTPEDAAIIISKVREIANEAVKVTRPNTGKKWAHKVGRIVWEAIELSPNFCGIGINIKKLTRR